jgi:hypothetical protein
VDDVYGWYSLLGLPKLKPAIDFSAGTAFSSGENFTVIQLALIAANACWLVPGKAIDIAKEIRPGRLFSFMVFAVIRPDERAPSP